MFCGISSKNIILKIGDNQRIKGIKFLFGQDIKVLNAYNQEGPEVPRSRNGPSELEDLVSVSHVLPNNCNGNYDEANDMIAVASTLEYLTAVIATGSPLDPLKLFSSNMSDTYYRYFKMTMEETIGQVNRFCEILQGYSGSKNRIC
ncbi:large protein containing a signal peptide [Cryptosporidium canis]|uniref:Large protein containing a signal peptide n=1 Tax=Cryptosporidium canis TaxID=195482 RepID=A0ABQ8PAX6_9CRYT|nr:large protein containing a signal peptide [Cryptosporidium canis]KAJ1614857.1 large protein containing a signal peptide [Cryptosporidium canis]